MSLVFTVIKQQDLLREQRLERYLDHETAVGVGL